jgi:hypothetical protein
LKDNDSVTHSATSVGKALQKLKPTFVHGLIHKQPGSSFSDHEIADYIQVRKWVLQTSPACKFDLVLDGTSFLTVNVTSYSKTSSISELLTSLTNTTNYYPDFKFDAIYFEHLNQAYKATPSITSFVIQHIHDLGMIVGGSTFGGSIPDKTDFIGLTTENFRIKATPGEIPAIGLLTNTDPLDMSSEACAFLNYYYFEAAGNSPFKAITNGNDRLTILRTIAEGTGYSFAWPIFSPVCPRQYAYDATKDSINVDGKSTVFNWIASQGFKEEPNNSTYSLPLYSNQTFSPHARNISNATFDENGTGQSAHRSLQLVLLASIINYFL